MRYSHIRKSSPHKRFGKTDRIYNYIFWTVGIVIVFKTVFLGIRICQSPYWGDFGDYLYNYSGGFIRRGLTGEILIFLKERFSMSPLMVCYVTSMMGYAIVACYVLSKFKSCGLGGAILITGFTLGAVFIFGFAPMRRDYMELALFIAIIWSYRRLKTGQWLVLSNVIAIFGILLHEATFFFMVPICILLTVTRLHSIVKAIGAWLPSITAFALCCIYKGDAEMYVRIIETAQTLAPDAFAGGVVPGALPYIGKSSEEVFAFHIGMNFTDRIDGLPLPVGIVTVFYFLYVPFITIAALRVFSRRPPGMQRLGALMSLIGFQFICLLPMFTVLSCDICRVCLYWVMSSLIVWLTFREEDIEELFGGRYNRLCRKAVVRMLSLRTARSKILLTFCVLFIGVTFYRRQPRDIVLSSPAGTAVWTAKQVIEKVKPDFHLEH